MDTPSKEAIEAAIDFAAHQQAMQGLQAEVERLQLEKQEAEESEMRISKKLQLSHMNCACDYDYDGDLCMAHFPAKEALDKKLADQRAEMERLQAEIETLRGNYLREGRQRDRLQVEVDWLKKDVEFLKRTSTCKCGDGFTEDDPGTCGNCLATRYLPG